MNSLCKPTAQDKDNSCSLMMTVANLEYLLNPNVAYCDVRVALCLLAALTSRARAPLARQGHVTGRRPVIARRSVGSAIPSPTASTPACATPSASTAAADTAPAAAPDVAPTRSARPQLLIHRNSIAVCESPRYPVRPIRTETPPPALPESSPLLSKFYEKVALKISKNNNNTLNISDKSPANGHVNLADTYPAASPNNNNGKTRLYPRSLRRTSSYVDRASRPRPCSLKRSPSAAIDSSHRATLRRHESFSSCCRPALSVSIKGGHLLLLPPAPLPLHALCHNYVTNNIVMFCCREHCFDD